MQGVMFVSPSSVVLTVGTHPDPTLASNGRLDAVQGFAARIANLAISSSPVALLFGADPDFQYFRVPGSALGARGAQVGNVGYFAGGAIGMIRKASTEAATRSTSAIARSFQGTKKYPQVDRFKDIVLKKGTVIYAGYPGQGAFYTTASAMRRSLASSSTLWRGLQIAPHERHPDRVRMAAYEVLEDTPAAFGLALANVDNGFGGYAQVVVPSFKTSLRYMTDFPLAP
jgi:hypothetical protein